VLRIDTMMLNVFLTLHHVLTILTLVWAVLLGKEPVEAAASPRYCGTLGSGVDRLRPPGPGWTLTQVQVVARHGARTPVADCSQWLPGTRGARWTCPVGHAERIDAGLLDDALADATALPLGVVAGVTVEIGADAAAARATYRKIYEGGALPGNCETGQLLAEGFAQHAALGRALRDAYVGGRVGALPAETVALRSSDLSRTRGSAEALADAFSPSAERRVLQTTDFAEDWIYPNANECPALPFLETAAFADPEFRKMNASDDDAGLREALGPGYDLGLAMAGGHLMDCSLTAVCARRDGLLGAVTRRQVDELLARMERREAWKLRYADRRYAKTVAAPLVDALRRGLGDAGGAALRVFLAHDTSLAPLLVALGSEDDRWPPYASAVVFERWVDASGAVGVRVAYDGRVLSVDGCDETPCPLEDFVDATAWVASRDCAPPSQRLGLLRASSVAPAQTPTVTSGFASLGAAFLAGALAASLAIRRGCAKPVGREAVPAEA